MTGFENMNEGIKVLKNRQFEA